MLDKIIVVDVESSCWRGDVPPGQVNEIIEVGIALLDHRASKIVKRESILVKPVKSTVSEFCTELTGHTQEKLNKDGVDFSKALRTLQTEYQSEKRIWASYGDYDRNQFQRQCTCRHHKYPFGPSHLNVKTLFALMYGLDKAVGMAKALKMLDLPLEGRHHNGGDDAANIARILTALLRGPR